MDRILTISKKHLAIYPMLAWFQAEKDGGPVLREEGHWTKINGILINTRFGHISFLFRRRGA